MFLSIQADFQLSTMQIGLNWKIALKWTFFINMNALKAIILCIFGVGMCPESLGQKKFFEIFFVTFTVESTIYLLQFCSNFSNIIEWADIIKKLLI